MLKESTLTSYCSEHISSIARAISSLFTYSYIIDMKDGSFVELSTTTDDLVPFVGRGGDAQTAFDNVNDNVISKEDVEVMREFTRISTLNERLKDKQSISIEFFGLTLGWAQGWFIVVDRDEQGNCLHVIWAVKDIHKRKEKEVFYCNELKVTNDIVANADMGLWVITMFDGEPPRITLSPKMRELLSLPDDMTDEEKIFNLWYTHINPAYLESVHKHVEAMKSGERKENIYLWADPVLGDQYVRCGGVGTKVEGKGWVFRGYHYNVNEEVLKEQQKQRQLEEANIAKSNFLFNMSHDIRTPLNAILGYSSLIKKKLTDPRLLDYQEKIEQSGNLLLSIINSVLDMSHIESGKVHLEKNNIKISAIASELFCSFVPEATKKNITINYETHIVHDDVICDVGKVKEIFANLASNALKYTPKGGKVYAHIEEVPCKKVGFVRFKTSLTDNGIGMSKEYLPTIFDLFSRERNTTTSKIPGTGLGMSIVKKLVDFFDGTIEVKSEPGKGTTFTVTLDYQIADKAVTTERDTDTPSTVNSKSLEGRHILLAEDNELNAEIATEIMEDMGLVIDHAEDGSQCVSMMENNPAGTYDIILMDIQMPVMNGYDATKAIRQMDDKRKASIPIIAMTANAFEEDKKKAFECGMNGHVAKPIDIDVLEKTLAALLTE